VGDLTPAPFGGFGRTPRATAARDAPATPPQRSSVVADSNAPPVRPTRRALVPPLLVISPIASSTPPFYTYPPVPLMRLPPRVMSTTAIITSTAFDALRVFGIVLAVNFTDSRPSPSRSVSLPCLRDHAALHAMAMGRLSMRPAGRRATGAPGTRSRRGVT
jgi:hypothetical protein